MKFLAKYLWGKLCPLDSINYDTMQEYRLVNGETYSIGELKPLNENQKRNLDFHRKYFVLIRIAWENMDDQKKQTFLNNRKVYRYYLTMKAGFVLVIETNKGLMYLPESIAFDKMKPERFEKLFNKTLDVVIEELGCDREDLVREVLELSR